MGIIEILDGYIEHQIEVITKRSLYDLKKAQERKHIVDGLIKAVSILDDVVHTIRHSRDKQDAKNNLQLQYQFSEKQAEAIVMLQLYRLTNTDILDIEERLKELAKNMHVWEQILQNEEALKYVMKTELKQIKNVPVIVTSAISDIDKKLDLFKLGADDYVTKPFNNDELLARINVHINKNIIPSGKIINSKDIELNTKTYSVTCKGVNINLSKIEFEILKLLMQENGRVVTKSTLFDTVWDNENSADENTLNVHISKIRNKLKKANPNKDYIETIWSIGYKFND